MSLYLIPFALTCNKEFLRVEKWGKWLTRVHSFIHIYDNYSSYKGIQNFYNTTRTNNRTGNHITSAIFTASTTTSTTTTTSATNITNEMIGCFGHDSAL